MVLTHGLPGRRDADFFGEKMLQVSDIEGPENERTDPRLRSESFRQDVRLVFDFLDIENTGRNFKEWDKIIDWTTLAHNINFPMQTARVEVLRHGLKTGGIITVKLPGRTRDEAIANLDESKHEFNEWSW